LAKFKLKLRRKPSEKFEQAFIEAFGQTGNGSVKPSDRLKQMFQRMLLWRSRIG